MFAATEPKADMKLKTSEPAMKFSIQTFFRSVKPAKLYPAYISSTVNEVMFARAAASPIAEITSFFSLCGTSLVIDSLSLKDTSLLPSKEFSMPFAI